MGGPASPLLRVEQLSVDFLVDGQWKETTEKVSFSLAEGETLALVGESGSGKSVTAMSILRLLPHNARSRGRILLAPDEDLLTVSEARLRKIRGSEIAVIFQEPMTALNPVYTIGRQISRAILSHRKMSPQAVKARVIELLETVHMPDAPRRAGHYPHQLSGGQLQRAMIAMAIAAEPKILIADEPTTALDVTVQAEILDVVKELQVRLGMAMLIITHDMGVVADVADRVVVMQSGRVVEEAATGELFATPSAPYTRELLSAVPFLGRSILDADGASAVRVAEPAPHQDQRKADAEACALEVLDLDVEYRSRFGRETFLAVSKANFSIAAGQIVGLVGESGSGKSTIGRAIMGLTPATGGDIKVLGRSVVKANPRQLREIRRDMGIVFQDPASSLNPRMSIGDTVVAPLRLHGIERDSRKLEARAKELLENVEIPPTWAERYPHELSGGQRQRIGIARAISLRPKILIADEPTSSLDVSVQINVLRLLRRLQEEIQFACVFISHDLAVVEMLASEIVVLKSGQIVESGGTADVLRSPVNPYTQRLIAAVPIPDPELQGQRRLERIQAGI